MDDQEICKSEFTCCLLVLLPCLTEFGARAPPLRAGCRSLATSRLQCPQDGLSKAQRRWGSARAPGCEACRGRAFPVTKLLAAGAGRRALAVPSQSPQRGTIPHPDHAQEHAAAGRQPFHERRTRSVVLHLRLGLRWAPLQPPEERRRLPHLPRSAVGHPASSVAAWHGLGRRSSGGRECPPRRLACPARDPGRRAQGLLVRFPSATHGAKS